MMLFIQINFTAGEILNLFKTFFFLIADKKLQ